MTKSYIKIVGKNTISFFPGRLIPSILGFLSVLLFTKILGVEKYGDYSLILATISIFIILSTVWLENTIIRFYPQNKKKRNILNYKKTIFISTIISILIFCLLYFIFIELLKNIEQFVSLKDYYLTGLLAFLSVSKI